MITTNGIIKAIVLLRGQVAGTWTARAGKLELHLWTEPSQRVAAALEREVVAVERYISASPDGD